MSSFSRIWLRTTDVRSAEAFYGAVLGHHADGIVALHESALQRGARPHWLGALHVGTRGVEAVAEAFIARGATRLGPPGIPQLAILRARGVIVGLTDEPGPSKARVVFHDLRTEEPDAALEDYVELFGWIDLGRGEPRHRLFAWRGGDTVAGIVTDIAEQPAFHPHWQFFFEVPAIDAACAEVEARGGVATAITLPNGKRVAVCDDFLGTQFALMEAAS